MPLTSKTLQLPPRQTELLHAALGFLHSTRSSLVLDDRKPLIDAAYEGLCDSETLKTAIFAVLTGDYAGRRGVRNQLAKRLANRPRGVGR